MISCRLLVLVILAAFTFVESLSLSAADDDRKAEYLDLRRLIGKENFKEAIARCKRLIDRYPDYLYLYETLAEVSLYADDLEEATRYFDGRIEEGLDVSLSYFGLGCVYYNKHNYEAAAICLERAIELGCKAPECHKYLEYAYEKLHGVDGAIRFFNSLCHRYPENANNWYALALAYWSKRQFAMVLSNLNVAMSLAPSEQKFFEAQAGANVFVSREHEGISLIRKILRRAELHGDLGGIQFLRSHLIRAYLEGGHVELCQQEISAMVSDAQQFGLFRWLGWGFKHMSDMEYAAGRFPGALGYSRLAITAAERAGDAELVYAALVRQFYCHCELGNLREALDCAMKRVSKTNSNAHDRDYVRSLCDVGLAYHLNGMDAVAADFALEALHNAETNSGDPLLLFQVHHTLGLIQESQNHFGAALHHYITAAALPIDANLKNRFDAVMHERLGMVYLRLGEFAQSRKHLFRLLKLTRNRDKKGARAYVLACVGDYLYLTGQYDASRQIYSSGLAAASRSLEKPTILSCARGLARLAEISGDSDLAVQWYSKAIEVANSMGPVSRRSFCGLNLQDGIAEDYRSATSVLSTLGKITDAFHTSEQEKIQSTFDQKTLSAQRASRLAPDSMRARIVSIRSTLERKYAASLIRNGSIFLEGKEEDLVLRNDIESLEIEYRRILDTLKARDPGFYDFLEPSSISLKRIQNLVLASDQALLEYSVGEKHTELFLVKRDTLIHSTVRKTREELSELLGKMSYVLREGVGQQTVMNAALANFDRKTSSDLYALLIGPLENHLRETTRLIIVPDDVLRGLPFEALVSESTGSRQHGFRNAKFLLERFEVSYASAATNLDPRYAQKRRADRLLLALGDPVVPENGRRSPGDPKGIPDEPIDLRGLSPLPGARQEVECLSDIFGDQADVVVGEKALKSLFKELAPHYRILHLAAHATHDEQEPIYSSIHLSRAPEKQGSSALHTFELLNIDLNADLAVLSACNTGPNRSGNGGNELGRSLMLAGVPSVVSSLWTVEDKSTAELMARFYSYIKRGERKSKALQLAKLDLIRSGKPDPYHWAAFLLEGDTSPIDISGNSPPNWKLFAVLGIFVITSAVFLQRKQFISRIKTSAGFGKK